MKVGHVFASRWARAGLLTVVAVVAVAAVVAGRRGGPAALLAILGASFSIGLLFKLTLETDRSLAKQAAVIEQLAAHAKRNAETLSKVTAELEVLSSRQRALNEMVMEQASTSDAIIRRIRETEHATRAQADTNDGIVKRLRPLERATARQNDTNDAIVARLRGGEQSIREQADINDRLVERLQNIERSVESADKAVSVLTGRVDTNAEASGVVLGLGFQALARRIPEAMADELINVWVPKLGLNLSDNMLAYLERKVISAESQSLGRLATTSSDAVLRALIARSLEPEGCNLLEVGVLFGVNAVLAWEAVGVTHGQMHQTLIDAFEGYYGEEAVDPLSGLPVTASIVEENLRRAGIPSTHYELITGYSADESVIERARSRSYSLILIDGDHSYEGVKADYNNYVTMLAPGGYMVFDDYGASNWPGVAKAVDEIVDAGDLLMLGTFNRTAVLRRPSVSAH